MPASKFEFLGNIAINKPNSIAITGLPITGNFLPITHAGVAITKQKNTPVNLIYFSKNLFLSKISPHNYQNNHFMSFFVYIFTIL